MRPDRLENEGESLMHALYRLAMAALLITGAALPLAACNTMSGMGQDVSAGGNAVTKGAQDVKQKM
jgi:entericidin B